MSQALRDRLIVTYCIALCGCLGCWRVWRRCLDGISAGLFARRGLVWAYWLFTFTVLADVLAALHIHHVDVTSGQFTILLLMALGTMLQMALVPLVTVPILMRFAPRAYSLTKALVIMGTAAFVSILMWAIALVALMHEYRHLGK